MLFVGCGAADDLRYASPAATFSTYREALIRGDVDAAWACLSEGYRQLEYDNDRLRLQQALREDGGRLVEQTRRLEIAEEREINTRLGFLLFDPTTVPAHSSGFFYFLRDADSWKITSHLDSLFRSELEGAIERGEYRLPY